MLSQRTNPKSGKREWCLVSRDESRVLEWFGAKRPSKDTVAHAEARVEYYKNQGK